MRNEIKICEGEQTLSEIRGDRCWGMIKRLATVSVMDIEEGIEVRPGKEKTGSNEVVKRKLGEKEERGE